MTALIAYYWVWLLLAFLLGLATAWWAWGQTPRTGGAYVDGIRDTEGPDPATHQPEAPTDTHRADDTELVLENRYVDDLTHIKGIDPQMAGLLKLLGVSRYSEIAGWSDNDTEEMSVLLGTSPVRIADGQWIAEASLLAAGNTDEFENRFVHL